MIGQNLLWQLMFHSKYAGSVNKQAALYTVTPKHTNAVIEQFSIYTHGRNVSQPLN